MSASSLEIEPFEGVLAVHLRDRGAVHVLFVAQHWQDDEDQRRACENVMAGILRAAAALLVEGGAP